MIYYPAQFEECFDTCDTGNGFVVTFRDVPEVITQGYNLYDAIEMGRDALVMAMVFYDDKGEERPRPSQPQNGDVMTGAEL